MLGALFLAVSPYAVEFGQEAALYALASLTVTLALAAGWHWRETGSRRDGVLYVGLGILAIYSSYVVAVILGLFAVVGLFRWAGRGVVRPRAWVVAHIAILAAWLPWFILLLVHWFNAEVPRATLPHTAEVSEIGGALTQFTSGTAALLRGVRPLEWAGLLLGAVMLGSGWVAGRQTQRRGIQVLLVISAAIFLVPWAVSRATGLWLFVPHFMLFLLPAILVTLAGGVLLLWAGASERPQPPGEFTAETQRSQRLFRGYGIRSTQYSHVSRITFYAVIAAWLLVQLLGLMLYYRYPPHGDDGLREIVSTINTEMQAGDIVLVTPPILIHPATILRGSFARLAIGLSIYGQYIFHTSRRFGRRDLLLRLTRQFRGMNAFGWCTGQSRMKEVGS